MSTILVIDDDEHIRVLVGTTLRKHGFDVIEAADGLTGVKLARSEQPDLIISDINMEQVDGHTAISVLRLHPTTMGIPIILMTGLADLGGMRRAMALGADDYLAKPFGSGDLLASVKMRLEKRQAGQGEANQKMTELRSSVSTMLPAEMLPLLKEILGKADLLINSGRALPPDKLQEAARAIRHAGERLQALTDYLLLYTQVELLAADAKKLAATREGVSADLSGQLKTQSTAKARECGRADDLILEIKPTTVTIPVTHLVKIIDELLEVAFTLSPSGTPVRVTASAEGPTAQFTISDRRSPPASAESAGPRQTAVGLALARRLVDLYGGTLVVKSSPGGGTATRVEFPG